MVSSDITSNDAKLATVKSFIQHLDVETKYDVASNFLSDDFAFVSPKYNCKSREQWLLTFPEFHKNPPTFEEPTLSEDDPAIVTRKGVVKFGFIKVSLLETFDFDDMGLIKSITAKRL